MNIPQLQSDGHSNMQVQEGQPIFLNMNSQELQLTTPHVMPTPTTNWSMESMPWKIKTDQTGDVMEFTAHTPNRNVALRRALLHQKRKSEFNAAATMPIKQFISEEKITAHFNGLHISSDYMQHSAENIAGSESADLPSTSAKYFSNLSYEDYQISSKEIEEKLRNAKRITVCEELKKFNNEQKTASYLPEALIHRMHKPCTALVLWQPSPIGNIFTQESVNKDDKTENNINEREEMELTDQNTTSDIDLSPLELDDIVDCVHNNNTCSLDFNDAIYHF